MGDMDIMGERIRSAREDKGYTLRQAAELIGISEPTLSRYEGGHIGNIPWDRLEKMAEVFGINPGWLLGWMEKIKIEANRSASRYMDLENRLWALGYKIDGDSSEGYQFLRHGDTFCDLSQEELARLIDTDPASLEAVVSGMFSAAQAQKSKSHFSTFTLPHNTSFRAIPLLGTIRAGRPIPVAEDFDGYLDLDVTCQADFALHVSGDSMSWAGIHSGDIALLVQGAEPKHGDIVAAGKADGDWSATLKYYIANNGTPRLKAGNPEYDDIPLSEGWSVVGTVAHIIKKAPSLGEYQELLTRKEDRDLKWDRVLATATEHGMDPERLYYLIMALK